jgi:hypothetical protein
MEAIPIQRGLFIPESLYRDLGEVEVVRRERELVIRPRQLQAVEGPLVATTPFDEIYQRDMAFIAEVSAAEPPFSRIRLRGTDDLGEEPYV